MKNILKLLIQEHEENGNSVSPELIIIFENKLNELNLIKDKLVEDFIYVNTSKKPFFIVVQNSIKRTKTTKSVTRDLEMMLFLALNEHLVITKRMYEKKEININNSFQEVFGVDIICTGVPTVCTYNFEVQKKILNSIDILFSEIMSVDDNHFFSLKNINGYDTNGAG